MWFEDFERKILQHSEAGGKPNRVLGRGKSLGTNLGGGTMHARQAIYHAPLFAMSCLQGYRSEIRQDGIG